MTAPERRGAGSVEGQRRRGRVAVVGVMLASLVAAGVVRYGATEYRIKTAPAGTVPEVAQSSSSRLSAMPSFATALLLGGLRGPLVMILWTSSESQKAEKKLEDFDTKVEWIRLLQPEFDSVHIFQIWNKAYNISVQMASLANKYSAILDALDYAHRIEQQRPNNINIEVAIGDVYFNKLGGSTEKEYYTKRVRQETQWREVTGPRPGDVGWRRTRLDPMLDKKGDILPEYEKELSYLKKYEPFPHGLSPYALAYNYYRRAQILQSEAGQRHLQLSDQVLDSRPALCLRNWAESEVEAGRKIELTTFGKKVPTERLDMELPTADVKLDDPAGRSAALGEAIYDYRRAVQLTEDSAKAYERHLREYNEPSNFSTFSSHLDHVMLLHAMVEGDADYLAAMRAGGQERSKLVESARQNYAKAIAQAERLELKYFVDDALLAQIHVQKADAGKMPDAQVHQAMMAVRAIAAQGGGQINSEDRQEYDTYIRRCAERLENLK